MPGAKFPEGYSRLYHEIMDKLMTERPAILAVTVPIDVRHARATFNYFRQSWLRQYEFFTKQKSNQQADTSYQIYTRLMSYAVGIDGKKLVFTSKELDPELVFETAGRAPQFFQHNSPLRESVKITKGEKAKAAPGLEAAFDEYISDTLKEAEAKSLEALGITKREQVIVDNPPPNSYIPTSQDEYAFFLAAGRPPRDEKELAVFLESGNITDE